MNLVVGGDNKRTYILNVPLCKCTGMLLLCNRIILKDVVIYIVVACPVNKYECCK